MSHLLNILFWTDITIYQCSLNSSRAGGMLARYLYREAKSLYLVTAAHPVTLENSEMGILMSNLPKLKTIFLSSVPAVFFPTLFLEF